MADAQEDTPAAPEEGQAEAPQEEAAAPPEEQAAPVEEAPAVEETAPEGETADAPASPPEEGAAATEEPPAETTAEEAEAKPEGGEGETEAAPDGGEEGDKGEEQQQAAAETAQEEGAKKEEGEQQEGGETDQPTEEVSADQPDGGEQQPAEPNVEGGEQGEGTEPAQQTEEEGAEAKQGEVEGETSAEKEGEAGEGEDGKKEGEVPAEGEEKKEGDEEKKEEEEQKEGEEAPQETTEGDETVKEVERGESPVAVGEKLSRGGTPDADDSGAAAVTEQERLEATTPDRLEEEGHEVDRVMREQEMVEEEEEEEEEEEMEEPAFKREELIERYHEALAEREQFQQQNYGLQHRLAEYFRKKKADERQDYDKNVTDQEQRYLKYMAQLEDLRRQDAMEKDNFRAQIEDAKTRCQEKKERVDVERKKFMEFKKQVALNAINSRSGKPIPPKDIEQYMVNEVKKEQEVIVVRLENIKLKNKLKKKEQQLKSKEELAEGLHLIDFEQLKIENQTYNEKIEERNEELLKLRKKITGTVQVLTHLKEKLQFVQGENSEQNDELHEVEATLAQSRDILSRTKQARDALRIDNQKLRQNCGLLGNEPLLRDFEERKEEGDDLRFKLDQLKMKHAELTLHCNQVRRKIDQARQSVV